MGVLKAKIAGVWTPISQGFDTAQVGYVGHAFGPVVDTTHTSGQPVTGMSVVFNAVAGHMYKTTANLSLQLSTTGYVDLWIADAANATQIGQITHVVAATAYAGLTAIDVFTAPSNATTTRKVLANASGGVLTVMGAFGRKGLIIVEDITPVQPGSMGIAQLPTYVYHGATAGTARPPGVGTVVWIGSVAPTNATTSVDVWINTA